jgi:hypothetical protein
MARKPSKIKEFGLFHVQNRVARPQRLPYPKATGHGAGARLQRHIPDSIATLPVLRAG